MTVLKIYGRANSINVRKVLWACEELAIPFEREDWGRGFRATTEPEFKALSGYGVIPVIDDEGFVLRESQAIVRYLCAREGRDDLLPIDIKARARVEAWMDWAATDVYADVRPVVHGLIFKTPGYDDPKQIARAVSAWSMHMQRLDDELAGGQPYLDGARFTAADIPTGLNINRWYSIEFEKPELPAVRDYYERLKERPGFAKYGANGLP